MPDDLPGNDPRTIWQNQPTELSAMTLEKIRHKALELQSKTRRELRKNVAVAVLAVAIASYGFKLAPDFALQAALALAIAWAVVGQYVLNRGMWTATPPGDAALRTGLDSYRWEIERRRYLFRSVLRWSFGPMVLVVAVLSLSIARLGLRDSDALMSQVVLKMAPFLTLLALWFLGVFVVRMRGQRELQREIDELDKVERENRQ